MRAILALGNPGDRYRDTRHNAGWWLADRLVRVWSLPPFGRSGGAVRTGGTVRGEAVEVLKPLTYVNRSGEILEPLSRRAGWETRRDLLVLVDDIWLEPGVFRLRSRGSPGGHRGLASLESAAGTREYARLRIGVGRPPDARIDLAAWVLSAMPPAEEDRVLDAFPPAVEAVECWLEEGIEAAMDRFNRR
ncbi:MAG: aminoacyl-tRNA hydrolase [Gemmatimonadota bacterium]